MLFGSRAKGMHSNRFDVDLAPNDNMAALGDAATAAELEQLAPLVAHIERVGFEVTPEP